MNNILLRLLLLVVGIIFMTTSSIWSSETNTNIPTDGIGETYISGSTFTNKKVTYDIKDDLAIFEGDIILGTVDEAELWREAVENPSMNGSSSIIISGDRYRWKDGILPYSISSNVDTETRLLISRAISHWESKTSIHFVERTSSNAAKYPSYVNVISTEYACWSYVGQRSKTESQSLNVVSACGFGGIVHEFGHALGLWHEQSREDRNQFIKINYDNIYAEHVHNFNQHISDGDDIGIYDYGSIMHYGSKAFSKNEEETITVLKPGVTIGQRNGLSNGDIASINKMYSKTNFAAPSNLKAINITKNSATLSWKDNSNNEAGFKIYQGTTLVKTVEANVKITSLTGLSANTSYTYTVKAYNATGESAGTSKTFKTKTDTVVSKSIITSPINNERVDKNTNLTLEWKNHGATKKRLVIYSYANGKWKKIAYKYLYSNETSYNFKLPKNFIRAHATIYSYNGEKDIGYSKVYLYPKIKLPNPVYLKLNNITSNSVSLRWQGGSMYASGFRIYEGETLVKTLELNQRNVVLTGLSADTTYIYTVKAYNNESESEGVSITVKTKADGSISESIITSLTNGSELAGDTNITLEWQNYGATKIILRINAYVNGKKITIANKNFTPPLDTKYNFKLPLGFRHASMQIVSYTGSKYIGSSLVNIYPKIKQLSDYATRYLNAINITENSATLKWHDNSKDETGFKIYNGTTLVKTVGKDVTSTEITGLSAHTNYTYTVKAYNTVSESKGTSTTFKTIFDPTENASIITSPLYGTKVYADTNITLRWNNYGATRMSLRIVAYIEGEAITVASEDFTTTSDISYNFKLPTRFTSASVILYSNKDSHYLGHSAIMLYPKE